MDATTRTIARLSRRLDCVERSLLLAETVAGVLSAENGGEIDSLIQALDREAETGLIALKEVRQRMQRLRGRIIRKPSASAPSYRHDIKRRYRGRE